MSNALRSSYYEVEPEAVAPQMKVLLTKSGTGFAMPNCIVDVGSELEKDVQAWLDAWNALPEDLRAEPLPWNELAKMDSITGIRDTANQKTFENCKLNLQLQEQFLPLLARIDEAHTAKRLAIIDQRNLASAQLAAVLGDRTGLPPVSSPAVVSHEMTMTQMGQFANRRAIMDAREGAWLAHAKAVLYSFLTAIIS